MHIKRSFKVLSLLMLVAIAAMAMSASAAQGAWTIKVGETTVEKTEVVVAGIESGEMIVEGLGLTIFCTGGTAKATVKGGVTLSGSGTVTLTGCDIKGATGPCDVKSPGQATGTILAKGEGTGKKVGTTVVATLESKEFTFVEIIGALCPVGELDAEVQGSKTLTLLQSGTHTASHTVEIDDSELLYGGEKVELQDLTGGTVSGTAKVPSQTSWSIQGP